MDDYVGVCCWGSRVRVLGCHCWFGLLAKEEIETRVSFGEDDDDEEWKMKVMIQGRRGSRGGGLRGSDGLQLNCIYSDLSRVITGKMLGLPNW